MHTLRLPKWAVTREQAEALMAEQPLPDRLDGQCFVLICNLVDIACDTFVDAVVEAALKRGVAEIALVGATSDIVEHAEEAAWRRGAEGVVAVRRAVEVGV